MRNLLEDVGSDDRALFVLAHPDDELLTSGGTFQRFISKGAQVKVVLGNHGRQGRYEISERFLNAIGASVELFPPTDVLVQREQLYRSLLPFFEDHIRRMRPTMVFTHGAYLGDHQEHEIIGKVVAHAWQRYRNTEQPHALQARLFRVCPMPGGSGFVPNAYCDITESLDQKMHWVAEMHRHMSRWYLEPEVQLRFSKAAGALAGCAHAELFFEDQHDSFFGECLRQGLEDRQAARPSPVRKIGDSMK